MSDLTIRPCGPVPLTVFKSIPEFCAILFASGDANTRLPDGVSETVGATFSCLDCALSTTTLSFFSSTGAAFLTGVASPISSALSPSSNKSAITSFTGTFSVPSETRILPIVPSSTASTSIVALSVSISHKTSPDSTESPSDLSHLASVPSVIVGDSAGIVMFIGIRDTRSF